MLIYINKNIHQIKSLFPNLKLNVFGAKSHFELLNNEKIILWHDYDDIIYIPSDGVSFKINFEKAVYLINKKIKFNNFE